MGGNNPEPGGSEHRDVDQLRSDLDDLRERVDLRDQDLREFLGTVAAAAKTVQVSAERLRKKL